MSRACVSHEATGRIVLNLAPSSDTASSLPEMILEDGDRLVIPSRPSTVQVIGAVFNQNAFLIEKDATVGRYLRLAGGPAREGRTAIRFLSCAQTVQLCIAAAELQSSRLRHWIMYGFIRATPSLCRRR